ncbi:hypothetical protein HOY80DRAFT_966730 [Tuber brumale]|nr:hypothetical protein HOY80DRAFT_966730 [Tuber brumale]
MHLHNIILVSYSTVLGLLSQDFAIPSAGSTVRIVVCYCRAAGVTGAQPTVSGGPFVGRVAVGLLELVGLCSFSFEDLARPPC